MTERLKQWVGLPPACHISRPGLSPLSPGGESKECLRRPLAEILIYPGSSVKDRLGQATFFKENIMKIDIDAVQNMSLEAVKAQNKNPKSRDREKKKKNNDVDVDENSLLSAAEGVF